ncbi:unnamed protein product [Arctia plantaginis]|uniref:Uncharacterized protein n=1 Tax=Arctia plantaginis TaxID=874455 RepID=A0A8S1AC36_ARCPL|nr:unnamed protein product [Arctia plantaginis]
MTFSIFSSVAIVGEGPGLGLLIVGPLALNLAIYAWITFNDGSSDIRWIRYTDKPRRQKLDALQFTGP